MPAVTQTALAYPYMYPSTRWLKQSLLLNDEIGSLVHPLVVDALEAGNRLPFGCGEALETDLTHLWDAGVWAPQFVSYLDDDANYLAEIDDALAGIAASTSSPDSMEEVFLGKLAQPVLDLVAQRGFVVDSGGASVLVEDSVATTILAVSAKYKAAQMADTGKRVVVSTDQRVCHQAAFAAGQPSRRADTHEAYALVLDGLVPTVPDSVSLDDVIAFRTRHGQELSRFRQAVHDLLTSVATFDDTNEPIRAARERLELELAALRGSARGSQLHLGFATMTVLATLPWAGDGGLRQAVAGGSLLAAASVVGQTVRDWRRDAKAAPYAYLHHAARFTDRS